MSDASSVEEEEMLPPPPGLTDDLENEMSSLNLTSSSPSIVKKLSFGSQAEIDIPERNSTEDADSSMVQVYLRIRPQFKKSPENDSDEALVYTQTPEDTIFATDTNMVQTKAPQDSQAFKNRETGGTYTFSVVFDKPTTQDELYTSTTANLVSTVLSGKDCLLFAYGVTNAGKTYTVEGSDQNPGIIPRAVRDIFQQLEAKNELQKTRIRVSYLQVYNEQIHDLQSGKGDKGESLKIKMRDECVEVQGLKVTSVSSCDDALKILNKGRETRTTHETSCNVSSSRSHSVFAIHVNNAKLFVVDLAGSERFKRTQTTKARQREASNINCSLMNLMRCLDTLRQNQKRKKQNQKEIPVPFRDSKLTLLFRDCFIGSNCGRVSMIVCASPDAIDYDETAPALKYGAIVKSIKVQSSVPKATALMSNYDSNGRRINTPQMSTPRTMSRLSAVLGGSAKNLFSGRKKIQRHHSANESDEGVVEIQEHPDYIALQQELARARMQCISLEAEIREEVAAEMASRLQEMESLFRKRVEAAKEISDNKSEQLLRNLRKRMETGGSNIYTMEDIESLVQNINECEEEMEKMRQLHSADLSCLNREIEQLKAQVQVQPPTPRQGSPVVSGRISLERLDKVVMEQTNNIARLEEELAEEKALHEMTQTQLHSATVLARDAQKGESAAEQQLVELRREINALKTNLALAKTVNKSLTNQAGIQSQSIEDAMPLTRKGSSQAINNENASGNNNIPGPPNQPVKKGIMGRMVSRMKKKPTN